MLKKLILPTVLALALGACSTTSPSGVRFLVGEGAKPRADAPAAPALPQMALEWARVAAPDVLVVGDVGAFNAMDGRQLRAFHQAYSSMRRVRGNADAFAAGMGGWSSIETFGLAGLVKLERPAAIRAVDMATLGFASAGGALFGATGDLVAARSDSDGILVLDKVLCKKAAADFAQCVQRHARGHFDQAGQELDGDLKPKRSGRRIDPANYALLPQAGAQ